jgi:NAD(P)-dependent dehydrogenase (short-subunit alcohol dehydrogenase family)
VTNARTVDLTGEQILVTGAGSGIGAAIAATLATHGASVAVNDIDAARADETTALILESAAYSGAGLVAVPGDVAVDAVGVVNGTVTALGGLTALVNNVGVVRGGPLDSLAREVWDETITVDLSSAFYVSQAAFTHLQGGGVIVNTCSLTALAPAPGAGAYNVAKAGILSLTQHLAIEWGPHGIRVNAVGPGLIPGTRLTPTGGGDEALRARRGAVVPLRRVGTPDDVADVVLFLVSDLSRYVTGHLVVVDGGLGLAVQTLLPT